MRSRLTSLVLPVALLAGVAPVSAAEAAPDVPFECRPEGTDDIYETARRLEQGWVPMWGFDAVRPADARTADGSLDWFIDPFHDGTWAWRYQSLSWVVPLFTIAERRLNPIDDTTRARYQAAAEEILADWLDHHGSGRWADRTWDYMASGVRAQVFACAATYLPDSAVVQQGLRLHARRLSDPGFYAGHWNHGFEQNLGLLAVGCMLGDEDAKRLAERRTRQAADVMLDAQGVTNEQSIGYSTFVYRLFGIMEGNLDRCGRAPLPEIQRRHLVPRFLAHATRPDGTWTPIGDTDLRKQRVFAGTESEYAATRGAAGVRPSQPVAIFDRGYVFGRSSWGSRLERVENASYYSLRFGPAREFHGHLDHVALTWYAQGRSLLTEAAFSGYNDDRFRDYERWERGHNAVILPGEAYRQGSATTLAASHVGDGWESYRLTGQPYRGVERTRSVAVLHGPDVVVVRDEIDADRVVEAEQRWHLDPAFSAEVRASGVRATAGDTALHVLQMGDLDAVSVVTGQKDPLLGWTSTEEQHQVPTPVVTSRRRGQRIEMLTVLVAAGSRVPVEAWGDGRSINVRVGEHAVTVDTTGRLLSPATGEVGETGGERLAGQDRTATAIEISQAAFGTDQARVAVLGRQDSFADALSGTPLATRRGGPLLLTPPGGLTDAVADELDRVLPPGARLYLLGGDAALAPKVEERVAELGYEVRRLAGASRAATAVEVAHELGDPGIVLLADGLNFPDGLAAGAAAARLGGAVLLTDGDRPHPATSAYLDSRPGATVYAIGGPASRAVPGAIPVVGRTRVDTATLVADRFFGAPIGVGLASAANFPDALAGGAMAARHGGPLLLTSPSAFDAAPRDWMCQQRGLTSGWLFGGSRALTDSVSTQFERALAGAC